MLLAVWLDENSPWEQWAKDIIKTGQRITDILAMRPCEILATFYTRPAKHVDKLEKLIADNRERGKKGLRPIIPPWLKDIVAQRTKSKP